MSTKNPRVLDDLSIICKTTPVFVAVNNHQDAGSEYGTVDHLLSQISQAEGQAIKVSKSETVLESALESEFNKHDPSLCPAYFEWCWCGLVKDLRVYNGMPSARNQSVLVPKVVIDCPPYHLRPHEKRDCVKDKRPFFKKIINSKDNFPCGKDRDLPLDIY